jgi:hypothetical protein
MDADDDLAFCEVCCIHFSSKGTLRQHEAAIHKPKVSAAPEASRGTLPEKSEKKRARPAEMQSEVSFENVELAPLLNVLSEAQKDTLILRAVRQDPNFYEKILDLATAPVTEADAEARAIGLDSEALDTAVHWYLGNGSPGNALTILGAASQRCLTALEDLGDSLSADGGGGLDGREELLAAVESAPPVGRIGALWTELLAVPAVAALIAGVAATEQADEIRLMLESMQAVAATVRPHAAAVLLGPNGETVETLAEALERLEAAQRPGGSGKKPAQSR